VPDSGDRGGLQSRRATRRAEQCVPARGYSALGVARKALAGDGKEWGWKLDSAAIMVARWQAEGGRDGGHTRGWLGGLK
jgi:hypothetical protein